MKIKYRYTYRLTRPSDGAFYIGSRSAATCPPEEDFGTHYFTSGVLEKEFRANPEQFTWEILSEDYADDVAMLEDEQRLIHESWDEPGRMNRSAWPVVFECDEEWQKKNAEANRLKAKDPVWLANVTEANRLKAKDPVWLEKMSEAASLRSQDPAWLAKNAAANRLKGKDPEFLKKLDAARLKARAPAARKKMIDAAKKREARKRAARLSGTEAEVDRMARKKMSEAASNRSVLTRKNMSEAATKREARKRAARLANEDTHPFDQLGVPVKKIGGEESHEEKR